MFLWETKQLTVSIVLKNPLMHLTGLCLGLKQDAFVKSLFLFLHTWCWSTMRTVSNSEQDINYSGNGYFRVNPRFRTTWLCTNRGLSLTNSNLYMIQTDELHVRIQIQKPSSIFFTFSFMYSIAGLFDVFNLSHTDLQHVEISTEVCT